ncbi:MAG: undecaprenyl-diphosphate phosphatase [Bacteroidetes bacterium]|nr:MAG: undecaprenyl-diphosphate phosphatase [Bacteroidota bacterium]
MNIFEAVVLAIVEGLTEFLPVSSTAHMIFASTFLGIQQDVFVKMFQVAIQFGAILAVLVLYWRRFFTPTALPLYFKLAVGVLPALVLGYLFDDYIEAVLEKPIPIAVVLILGGVVLLLVDKWFKNPTVHTDKDITFPKAFAIGFWQCLAMMPGVSRSAASIIGGMQQKLNRNLAAEFSFFLAVPTMMAVNLYSVFLKKWDVGGATMKGYEMILATRQQTIAFLVGNAVAFLVAIVAIKFLITLLKKYGFRVWGIYRIAVGVLLLVLFLSGVVKTA